MDHAPPARPGRRALRVALFLGSSALAALALSAGLRTYLPYESLRRFTPEARFLVWEGALWMMGLAMLFLGGAGALGTLHLGRIRVPGPDEIRSYAQDLRPRGFRFSPLPWWLLCTGAVLLGLAIRARAALPG